MYRVITKYRDGRSPRPIVERGPWHDSIETAEYWAEIMRAHGYVVEVQSQFGHAQAGEANDNKELASALASMA